MTLTKFTETCFWCGKETQQRFIHLESDLSFLGKDAKVVVHFITNKCIAEVVCKECLTEAVERVLASLKEEKKGGNENGAE